MPETEKGEPVGGPLVPMHCLQLPPVGPPRRDRLPNGTPIWLVTRYPDVRQALVDGRYKRSLLFAPDAPRLSDNPNLGSNQDSMFHKDGAEHHRLRRVFQRSFTPRYLLGGPAMGLPASGPA